MAKGKKKNTPTLFTCLCQEISDKTLYRVRVNFIPDSVIGLDGCYVQEMISKQLGGVRALASHNNGMCSFWHLKSCGLALDYLALSVLCCMGDKKYYKKLKADVIKDHAKLASNSPDDTSNVAIVGYPTDSHCTNPSGVIGYYLIANKDENKKDHPQLVVAIPSHYHSVLRASGPVNKKMLGKGNTTSFIRLL